VGEYPLEGKELSQPVDSETFVTVIRQLLRLIVNGQKETEILHRLLALGAPLPHAKVDKVRQEVTREIDPVIHSIAEMPADTLLEFLQRFQGTIQ
jgi:hypothetical protein